MARPQHQLGALRVATLVVLALAVAVSAYMPLFAFAWLAVGTIAKNPGAGNVVFAIVIAVWLALVAFAGVLIWRLATQRTWWSPVGGALMVGWAVFSIALGVIGFPFFSPQGILGLIGAALMFAIALRERSMRSAAAL
jgi:hypothetical protein